MSSLANAAQRLGLIGDEALRIVRTTVDGVAFPPYWMEERNHVFAIHTGLEARGWECDEQVSGADLSSEIVFDGVRVPVCIEVFKGHTMQGAIRFGAALPHRRKYPIVFAVVLLEERAYYYAHYYQFDDDDDHSSCLVTTDEWEKLVLG